MDALDAGAYVHVFEADVPKTIKVVLWGPLHAKQMGFEEWNYQDGGETGFVYHTNPRAAKMGLVMASLIVKRRIEKAYLTVYLGGYPTDAAPEQRALECQNVLTEAEMLLTRLCNQSIKFQQTAAHELVHQGGVAPAPATPAAKAPVPRSASQAARRPRGEIIEA